MRHRSIALPLAVLALFAVASIAFAGGWAQVNVTNVPADPPPGEETTIQLNVLQHGMTPVSWPGLTVVATDATTGAVVRVAAKASGPEGAYAATLVFPSAGEWRLTFESPNLLMEGSAAIHVANPAAAAFNAMPLLLTMLAAFAVLAIGGLALRGRAASAGSRVSVRT